MEFWCLKWNDFSDSFKYARKVSVQTGCSILYHWLDLFKCYSMYGCGPNQYFEGGFYKLRSFDRRKTYTKGRIDKVREIFNDKNTELILKNKALFNQHFSRFLLRKWLYCLEVSMEEIQVFVQNCNTIIVKPIDQSKGNGIYLIDKSEMVLSDYVGKNILLEECLSNHPQMSFNNRSLNTLRINTIIDKEGKVNIIKVSLRCGVGDSVVDNYCSGGVVYPINKEYGRIEGPGGNSEMGQTLFVHPGSDIFMVGREIPCWEEAVKLVTEAAKTIPKVRFVGWDIAITKDGPAIIEGNQRPGAQLIEYQGFEKGLYYKMLSYK